MTAFAIPVPPGWSTQETSGEELLRADMPGARMYAALVHLTDPRRTIPQRVQDAAGGEAAVTTSYLDIPAGRAVLAQAVADRAAAQLWLPLPDSQDALVVSVIADAPAQAAAVAELAAEIGTRLTREDTVVRRRGPIATRTVAFCTNGTSVEKPEPSACLPS